MSDLDNFLSGYATAILWANAYKEDPETGEMVLDEDATYAYQGPGKWWESIDLDLDDAVDFFNWNHDAMIATGNQDFSAHGHDFALTRNGHGAGFWDRGYGEAGEALTANAKPYGEHSVLTNDGPTVTNI